MGLVLSMCGAGRARLVGVECQSHLRPIFYEQRKGVTFALDDSGVVVKAPRVEGLSAHGVELIVASPFRDVVDAVVEHRSMRVLEVREVWQRRKVRSLEGEIDSV